MHCARCHNTYEYDPALNKKKDAPCKIDHGDDCRRIRKNGQVSSVWKFECCGYTFKSPYCDEPDDEENGYTDKGLYCFVGAHEPNGLKIHYDKIDTYDCADNGCVLSPVEVKQTAPPPPVATGKLLHCIRCHEMVDEGLFQIDGCVVEHDGDTLDRTGKNGMESMWKFGCSGCEFLARSPDSPDLDIDEDDDEKLYCYVGSHTTDHEYLDSDGASLEKECKYCEDAMEEE